LRLSRGLAALSFLLIFQTTLLAQYLYKDEVVNNPKFNHEIELLGSELYEKTGIALRLIMIRDLPEGMNITEYQANVMQEFNSPTVLLTFAELNTKVDIFANDPSLYEYFNKKQILSPIASTAQAVAMALFFADDFDDFKSLLVNSGGTILPLLGNKSKGGGVAGKYSAAMYNGYLDLGEQISRANNVELTMATGNGSKYVIMSIKIIFYSIILIAIFMYIRKKIKERRKRLEVQ